ncbi:TIGR04552 family protein [Oligoflexaceae bacterium]|nr:TIGR04552 family protein [Oligoflexaceae bacterium]
MQSLDKQTVDELHRKWDFNWPVMQVMIGGRSAIDLPSLKIKDEKEAHEFIVRYGFDPNRERDRKKMHAVMVEALSFMERYLIPDRWKRGVKPPEEILYCSDIVKLVLLASHITNSNAVTRAWACSVLRLMHTIVHIEGTDKLVELDSARRQILVKFHQSISVDENGRTFIGHEDQKLELDQVEFKTSKSRHSIILKLLHKPANVAETIYDLIGVRIVTKNIRDVLLVIKYLRDQYLITFPNCNPTRARNSLVDTEQFRHNVDLLLKMIDSEKLDPNEFEKLLENMTTPLAKYKINASNPHSASGYRSVQLTCRQLVRMQTPLTNWAQKLDRAVNRLEDLDPSAQEVLQEITQFAKSWQMEHLQEMSTFFPFEVQVLDKASHIASKTGEASHSRYKEMQVRTARRRLLGDVLKLTRSAGKS